ncbi:MAG: pyridoxamine 5'-phosphate oxidase family protein [Chloroflexi bacterium]|nr:pyridoxamine 5'-phosphate oxidase family protein [Chloroflexota bacterium]
MNGKPITGDRKLEHLRRDPRCVLLIFETVPPFRGVRVRGRATIEPDTNATTRLAIASRYWEARRGAGRVSAVLEKSDGVASCAA